MSGWDAAAMALCWPYSRRRFRYFDEILKALSPSDPCRVVTLEKSAQIGGTVVANVFTGGSVDMDPSDFMYVHPTEGNAQRWSRIKLSGMLKGTPRLKELFPQKSRDGSDSIMYKERVDGLGAILISGANSPATLSQVTMPRQVQDDLSKWEANAGGDPETQADSRSRGVEMAKIFKVSTPLVQPGCKISRNFQLGSQEYCFVPCPHCKHMQVLEWDNMAETIDEDRPEETHFTCVECEEPIREYHRAEMIAGLEWRAANPKMLREHRSFHIWSAYSDLQSWKRIAQEWFNAKGDPASEQTFYNDVVGKAYSTQGEAPPWEALRDRAADSSYVRKVIPRGGLLLTIGMDVQVDRVEWQVVAFGRDFTRFVVEYGVTPGHISEARCQEALSTLVEQPWTNEVGQQIKPDLTAIDGNAWTEEVWSWAQKHSPTRVIMVRGNPRDMAPMLVRVKKERTSSGVLLRYSSRFYNFGANALKMIFYRNLEKTDPGERGHISFPRGLDDEYFRQITSEKRSPQKRNGFTSYIWKKDSSQANEGLDTMLQAEAAALKLGIRNMPDRLWDRLETERWREPDEPSPPSVRSQQARPARRVVKSSYMG